MIGLPYGEKNYDDRLSCFHTIPACYGQTDGQTDRRNAISISRVSVLTRDKNEDKLSAYSLNTGPPQLSHFTRYANIDTSLRNEYEIGYVLKISYAH